MNSYYKSTVAIIGLACSTPLFAQSQDTTPPATPGAQTSDPSSASTPHQRAAVKSSSNEAPAAASSTGPDAAATPQQKDQLKKKHKAKPAAPTASP